MIDWRETQFKTKEDKVLELIKELNDLNKLWKLRDHSFKLLTMRRTKARFNRPSEVLDPYGAD